MTPFLAALLLHFFAFSEAQQSAETTPEVRPTLNVLNCLKGGCKPANGTVVLDANWRYLHTKDGKNCYKGNLWDTSICTNGDVCAEQCALDGASYKETYGITSTGDALTLTFVTNGPYSQNIGSRVYLLGDNGYRMFKLKNKEFSFDVDVSKLTCGLNGALYFAAMEEDGGMSKFPKNLAGYHRGTGYCDAQCPQDIKFIGGKANSEDWKPDPNDPNTGTGHMGSCCSEMDVWEANSVSQAFTPHTCAAPEPTICQDAKCGNTPETRYDGPCDKDGCDFASYRWGATEFYGKGKKVDTTNKFTVTTQFITSDNTDTGELVEIRRSYTQGGKLIKNEAVNFKGLAKPADSITQDFCDATKTFTNDKNDFKAKGGLKAMGDAMERGMVLIMSLWDDKMANMQWLDGTYPPNKPADGPGVKRGTCDATSGKPATVRKENPGATVEFSNIKFGEFGTTNAAVSGTQTTTTGASGTGGGNSGTTGTGSGNSGTGSGSDGSQQGGKMNRLRVKA